MQSTMTYVLSYIKQNIPDEILQTAFRPREFSTTLEQRIISQIIEGPILLDTNLVGGKRRDIILHESWRIPVKDTVSYNILGSGVENSYFRIPPEAREYRNISSVIGTTPYLGSSLPGVAASFNGMGNFGNTATGLISNMLGTRTMAQYPVSPRVTLEGTNIVCFYPDEMTGGFAIAVMLEFDSEFLNMSQSGIIAMRNLCLCATQRYIATKLRVQVDETEIVSGMEIGVVKDIINEYVQKAEQYDDLLKRFKGASLADPRAMERLIYYAL